MNNKVELSIIVLTYNALKYTKKCLDAIKANTIVSYELIVIDNASGPSAVKWLKENVDGDNIKVVFNKKNKGVAGGRNQGIGMAKGDIIVFLDNDTEVQPGWDFSIIDGFSVSDIGIVGKSGVNIRTFKPLTWEAVQYRNGLAEVEAVSGFCFAFRKKLLSLVGYLWEDYPNPRFWHEDLEFCQRVKLAGYKVLCNKEIPIIHHEHKSMGDAKNAISKEINQFGYYENAMFIQSRLMQGNIVTIYASVNPESTAAFSTGVVLIAEELRSLGMVVVIKPPIITGDRSFDLCKMFDLEYLGKRYVALFQENDKAPRSWNKQAKFIDGIFAGSYHLKSALSTCPDLLEKLIFIEPAGYDSDVYNFNYEFVAEPYDKFTFLMVAATQPRKGIEFLLRAFYEEFKGRADVQLKIKDGGYGQMFETSKLISEFTKNPDCPTIDYIYADWSSDAMSLMYQKVAKNGVYVHPHRAECFGIPILEAIACDCRVITTGWGGPAQTVSSLSTVSFVDYKLVPSSFHNWSGEPFYEKDENPLWAEPSVEDLREKMRVAFNTKVDYKEIRESANMVQQRYSYKAVARNIFNFLSSKDNEARTNSI